MDQFLNDSSVYIEDIFSKQYEVLSLTFFQHPVICMFGEFPDHLQKTLVSFATLLRICTTILSKTDQLLTKVVMINLFLFIFVKKIWATLDYEGQQNLIETCSERLTSHTKSRSI